MLAIVHEPNYCETCCRWEFVFQPKYAAYLNLIEPWWKALRSLALTGRRFGTWDEVTAAIAQATEYWNAHRHPSPGDSGVAIARAVSPASRSWQRPRNLPDEPLRRGPGRRPRRRD